MSERVAIIARVVAQRDGQIELERLVTPEMAERMRREADAQSDKARMAGRSAVQEVWSPTVAALLEEWRERFGEL